MGSKLFYEWVDKVKYFVLHIYHWKVRDPEQWIFLNFWAWTVIQFWKIFYNFSSLKRYHDSFDYTNDKVCHIIKWHFIFIPLSCCPNDKTAADAMQNARQYDKKCNLCKCIFTHVWESMWRNRKRNKRTCRNKLSPRFFVHSIRRY